jgi:hypothetical protein
MRSLARTDVAANIERPVLAEKHILKVDQRLVEKFGDAYRRYMERVPRGISCPASSG